jgi:hypothetical protein
MLILVTNDSKINIRFILLIVENRTFQNILQLKPTILQVYPFEI